MTDFVVRALLIFVFGFFVGAKINGLHWENRLKSLENGHKEALNAAQKAATDALEKARDAERRGDQLAQERLALEATNETLLEEKRHALRKATTGRACLDAGTVRLLNGADPAPDGRGGLRSPAGGAFGSAPGLAADSGDAASDTDVALWAAYAKGEYERCRGRIDALRTFFEHED